MYFFFLGRRALKAKSKEAKAKAKAKFLARLKANVSHQYINNLECVQQLQCFIFI